MKGSGVEPREVSESLGRAAAHGRNEAVGFVVVKEERTIAPLGWRVRRRRQPINMRARPPLLRGRP
jgi:hypothetical protein